ncbi:MAG TPA: glycosyltransferase family 2 protein [Solirubrobacteraceae bacterium]
MTAALIAAAIVIGLPGLLAALHLGLLAIGSWFYREPTVAGQASVRWLVLVPAHNEERVIEEGLAAINRDRRARDIVLVVADRCTDRTAEIARSQGAVVLERGPGEPPGRAAARQAGLEYARALKWDAVVMLDADSVIEPGFFSACERALSGGAQAVQARSESRRGRTWATEASLAAFTLQGITIPRGRDRLGISVRLRGTGMAIRREVALVHRFHAPASEDLFFTQDLLLEGIRCRHVDSARLHSQGASSWGTFGGQKLRYEAGRMAAARTYLPRLIRRAIKQRDVACLEAAWFLASPPFAPAAVSLLLAAALSAVAGATPLTIIFLAGLATLALAVVTGLIQARVRPRTWLALGTAPWYLAWKTLVQLRAIASVLRRDGDYGPTART